MTVLVRTGLILGLAFYAMPAALAAKCCQHEHMAGKCSACSTEKGSCDHGCSHGGGKCDAKACCSTTQWADPADVHWVHKRVSFGNYMKMAKAEIPAPQVTPSAPSFGPIFFDKKKSHMRVESVEVGRQAVAYLKAYPNATVRIEAASGPSSDHRAATVKKFLVENGIAAERISVVVTPKGGQQPAQLQGDVFIRVN